MDEVAARTAIREIVENWVVWRDAGDWARFRTVWHEDARMHATWFQGSAADFIDASREGWAKGVGILHFLGGHSAEVAGTRDRADQDDDLAARRRRWRALRRRMHRALLRLPEHRNGRWAIALRQPIYEKDRLDPVDPAAKLSLDVALLQRFPEGYRHLAYLQTRIGYTVKRDMPGLKGAEVEALYAKGKRWLEGGSL